MNDTYDANDSEVNEDASDMAMSFDVSSSLQICNRYLLLVTDTSEGDSIYCPDPMMVTALEVLALDIQFHLVKI